MMHRVAAVAEELDGGPEGRARRGALDLRLAERRPQEEDRDRKEDEAALPVEEKAAQGGRPRAS